MGIWASAIMVVIVIIVVIIIMVVIIIVIIGAISGIRLSENCTQTPNSRLASAER